MINNLDKFSKIIHECYLKFLDRDPDEMGHNYYHELLEKNEIDEKGLEDIIKRSDEYKKKIGEYNYKELEVYELKQKSYSTSSNLDKFSKIIHECYLKFLDRDPDEMGHNYYHELLEKNEIDEKGLEDIIKRSDEYRRKNLAKVLDKEKPYLYRGLFDITYIIRPSSTSCNFVVKDGIYDKWLATKLKKIIPTDGVIFDVGANEGLLTLPFAKLYVPDGTVYAFEPNSEIRKYLNDNIRINNLKNVIVSPYALQDDPNCENTTLFRRMCITPEGYRNTAISTILPNPIFNVDVESVPCSTIDKFVDANKILNIPFIKIDAEGADYKILCGAEKTINNFHPIIAYEYSIENDKVSKIQSSKNCFEFMKDKKYRQYRIVNNEKLVLLDEFDSNLITNEINNIICFYDAEKLSWLD